MDTSYMLKTVSYGLHKDRQTLYSKCTVMQRVNRRQFNFPIKSDSAACKALKPDWNGLKIFEERNWERKDFPFQFLVISLKPPAIERILGMPLCKICLRSLEGIILREKGAELI